MTLNFTSAKDSIKNYEGSKLAKSEKNDCVVRAFAAAFDIEYDRGHAFVAKEFNREFRKGTSRFNSTMTKLANDRRKLNYKSIKTISSGEIKRGASRMTVGSFVKDYDRGSYIIVIARHAFTVRDGVVVGGNTADAKRMRCIVKGAWKVS